MTYGEPPTSSPTYTELGIIQDIESEQKSEYEVFDDVKIRSPFSVYFVNTRNVFPDNYPAKFDEELAKYLIETYTKPEEIVFDPMSGSGTIPLVAMELERQAIYQDINSDAEKLFLEKVHYFHRLADHRVADSTEPFQFHHFLNNSVDFILTSPPFGLSIDATHDKYSDNKDDLGNASSYENWRAGMKKILKNCYDVLKPGKLAIFETRPRSKAGHTYPLNMWIAQDGQEVGFNFFSEMIEVVDYYRMVTYGKKDLVKPIPKHAYLTMLQKPINEKLV
jgi:DNA modification methylase